MSKSEIAAVYLIMPREGSEIKEGSAATYVRKVLTVYNVTKYPDAIRFFTAPIDTSRASEVARALHESNQKRIVEEGGQWSNFDISEWTIYGKDLPSEVLRELMKNVGMQKVSS